MIQTKYKNIFIEGTDVYKLMKNGEYHKLSKWVDNLGYYMVSFRIEGKRKYVRVHKIIAETLVPNPNNLPQVNHINGKKLDNDPSNLEWVTNSYNTQHGYDTGLYHSYKRSHPIKAINKITKKEFIFCSIRKCAKELELNRKTITSILKGDKKINNYDYEFEYL